MKKFVLMFIPALICGIVFTSCDRENLEPEVKIEQPVEELYEKLETAFQVSSTDDLVKFFRDWNVSISSNTVNFIKQDKISEAIFEIYKEFYSPLDLTNLGDWEWGNSLNSNSKYVAVQNKIVFAELKEEFFDTYFYQGIYETITFDTICDFRPPLNLGKDKVLYLTPNYEKSLNMFLGTQSTEMGENGIMTPSMPREDSEKRYSFIRPYIPILHGHWGGYWHLATHPEISWIVIDTKNGASKVYFRVGYQGGEALLKKKSNGWKIVESRATWIE